MYRLQDGRKSRSVPVLRRIALVILLAVSALTLARPAAAGTLYATFSWAAVAAETVAALDEASLQQADGNLAECKRAIARAYFGIFEEQKMEAAMRKMLGQGHAFMVERQFSNLRRSAATASPEDFRQAVAALAEQLRADAQRLDELAVPREVYDVQ